MIRKLCRIDNLPAEGKLKAFANSRRESHLSLCVGVLGGNPYAVDNLCPHQSAPLAAGKLDGENVVAYSRLEVEVGDLRTALRRDPAFTSYKLRQYDGEVFVRIPTERVGIKAFYNRADVPG